MKLVPLEMQPLNYIIFHPDSAREVLTIRGRAIKNGHIEEWDGSIWIDKDDGGNEDPYVLSETWIYSFCHATCDPIQAFSTVESFAK